MCGGMLAASHITVKARPMFTSWFPTRPKLSPDAL
jgi:hypothetical protein